MDEYYSSCGFHAGAVGPMTMTAMGWLRVSTPKGQPGTNGYGSQGQGKHGLRAYRSIGSQVWTCFPLQPSTEE